MKFKLFAILIIVSVVVSACAPPPTPPNAPPTSPSQLQAPTDASVVPTIPPQPPTTETAVIHSDAPHTSDVDLTRLTVGDGKYSTSPQIGFVYSCQTQFTGGGASGTGNWMNGD